MIYDNLIERLLQHYAGSEFREEVGEAKKEFFDQAGIVDQDTEQFEIRMAQFLDWYLFTRENAQTHLPPIQMAFDQPTMEMSDEDRASLENLIKCNHSLFELNKIRGDDVFVKDLISGKKLVVRDSYVTAGFNQDEIFEARVVPHGDNWIFCKGFCFHPPEATKFIVKEIKKVKHLDRPQKEALVLRLMKMRYKHEQYRHIRLEYIYTNDSKLRL